MHNANMGALLERIAIDIMRPLPESHKGSKYVLIICDFFKWTEALLHDQGAPSVANIHLVVLATVSNKSSRILLLFFSYLRQEHQRLARGCVTKFPHFPPDFYFKKDEKRKEGHQRHELIS